MIKTLKAKMEYSYIYLHLVDLSISLIIPSIYTLELNSMPFQNHTQVMGAYISHGKPCDLLCVQHTNHAQNRDTLTTTSPSLPFVTSNSTEKEGKKKERKEKRKFHSSAPTHFLFPFH